MRQQASSTLGRSTTLSRQFGSSLHLARRLDRRPFREAGVSKYAVVFGVYRVAGVAHHGSVGARVKPSFRRGSPN